MNTESRKRGRPAEYRNAAEKQKAYRERLKTQNTDSQLAFEMLELLEQAAQVLRNHVAYHAKRSEEVVIHHSDMYTQTTVGGYSRSSVQQVVFQYLLKRGELEYIRKDWHCEYYRLKS